MTRREAKRTRTLTIKANNCRLAQGPSSGFGGGTNCPY